MGADAAIEVVGYGILGGACLYAASRKVAGWCRDGGHRGVERYHRAVVLGGVLTPVLAGLAEGLRAVNVGVGSALSAGVELWGLASWVLVPTLPLLYASVAPDEPAGERWVVGFQLILGWGFVQVAWMLLVMDH